jgi:hypothetical protein
MAEGLTAAQRAEKARVVAELLTALVESDGVHAALRACAYQNVFFVPALFFEALRERFGADCDLRVITAFVRRIRDSGEPAPLGFPSREAEALIRVGLGDGRFLTHVDPNVFSYLEIEIAILERLFAEWQPGEDELSALFAKSREAAAEKEQLPELEAAESRWFAAGMPYSPFATQDGS